MLSNGPGDPADNTFEIAQIAKLLGKIPLFGICLGHQLTAIAAGGTTEKLKFGHRGANQPVRDLADGRTRVTSQNHGYAVVSSSLPPSAKLRFVNANDGSCEGIDYPEPARIHRAVSPGGVRGAPRYVVSFRQIHRSYEGGLSVLPR